jgi:ACS family tartrate transporter-like MFS transporter
MRKVWWRLVPLLGAGLCLSYLDRVNVGFAALTMNHALGFTNSQFGVGVGFFAFGYMVFGIPSAMLVHRLGARRWLAVIVLAWGVFSASTAAVSGLRGFVAVRFLLGAAEAGFAPGAVVFFSRWIPAEYRGRVFGSYFLVQPIAQMIAGPISSVLLSCDGRLGLAGWQWLFVVEALPTLFLAIALFGWLGDTPEKVGWLTPVEKEWIAGRLARDRSEAKGPTSEGSFLRAFASGRLWLLAVVCLGIGTCGLGTVSFLPLIIRSLGFSVWNTGFVAVLPAAATALCLPLWGAWTDRSKRADFVVAAGCASMVLGTICTAVVMPSPWALVPLSLTIVGFFGCLAAFWTLPAKFLSGSREAAGVGFLNVAGNLGQFTGPYLLGRAADLTRTYAQGLAWLGAAAAVGGIVAMALGIGRREAHESRAAGDAE